jgi:mono/diheme cytochrome c family protein
MRRGTTSSWRLMVAVAAAAALLAVCAAEQPANKTPAAGADAKLAAIKEFVAQFCSDCHNSKDKAGELALDSICRDPVGEHAAIWEKVVRKIDSRQMPPLDAARPDMETYAAMLSTLETALDAAAAAHPNPGRTAALHRLNRTEYQNAIRDLLALNIDATELLPRDEASHGFDNVLPGDLSPTLLDRYVTAAQKISHLAVGTSQRAPSSDTIRIRADLTQEEQVEGLPFGTRGGALIPYIFPQDGKYDIQIWLARDRNEHVEGLDEEHHLEVLLDRKEMASLTVSPPADKENHQFVDANLKARITVTAGEHDLGVTFSKNPSSLLETRRQPYQAHFNMHRHPRISPAVYQVSITGPYEASGTSETASRQRIFISRPTGPDDETACARQIFSALLHRAYRRPVAESDLKVPMKFYNDTRKQGGFEDAIEKGLSAILVNPQFLFRVEQDPPDAAAGSVYRISDLELASRLSFFLWSSIPDDELLALAERNELSKPDVFERQVRRMLADRRAENLATNFAGQWLYLRNLATVTPDMRLFPDFDDNLRQAFRQETELFFGSIVEEDRSVLDLLKANYTFLNERLAKHYGIPNIYGNRFRRVELADNSERGGLLRQGSILTVTSYATRTSPVIRGKWVLENLLGSPPPRPPANVPSLKDNTIAANLSVRQRLAEHRANAACATCHRSIDPVGFTLEEFDAIGRWRDVEEGEPIDDTGGLPDGRACSGVSGLEQALLDRPELFVRTLVEKMMTFALAREVETFDAPAIRQVVRDAKEQNYRFSSLILGIATSTPFQMRRSP